jgi:hypothetical protein
VRLDTITLVTLAIASAFAWFIYTVATRGRMMRAIERWPVWIFVPFVAVLAVLILIGCLAIYIGAEHAWYTIRIGSLELLELSQGVLMTLVVLGAVAAVSLGLVITLRVLGVRSATMDVERRDTAEP